MQIGDSVLGTYRYFYGEGTTIQFVDIRRTGVIDSPRMPLGYYWMVFALPDGGVVRQMNHETEIGGEPRKVQGLLGVLASVRKEARIHLQAGWPILLPSGEKPTAPATPAVLDALADIGQEEVIL